jgi:hypothetical protein
VVGLVNSGSALGYLQAQDPPYKGKTIRVIVGFPAGAREVVIIGKLLAVINRCFDTRSILRPNPWTISGSFLPQEEGNSKKASFAALDHR